MHLILCLLAVASALSSLCNGTPIDEHVEMDNILGKRQVNLPLCPPNFNHSYGPAGEFYIDGNHLCPEMKLYNVQDRLSKDLVNTTFLDHANDWQTATDEERGEVVAAGWQRLFDEFKPFLDLLNATENSPNKTVTRLVRRQMQQNQGDEGDEEDLEAQPFPGWTDRGARVRIKLYFYLTQFGWGALATMISQVVLAAMGINEWRNWWTWFPTAVQVGILIMGGFFISDFSAYAQNHRRWDLCEMLAAEAEQQMLREMLDRAGGGAVQLLNRARGTYRAAGAQVQRQNQRTQNVVRRGGAEARRLTALVQALSERLRTLEAQQGSRGPLKARQESQDDVKIPYEESDLFLMNQPPDDTELEPLAVNNHNASEALMPSLESSDYASQGYNFDGSNIADFAYGPWWEDITLIDMIAKMHPDNVFDIMQVLPSLSIPSLNLETSEFVDASISDETNICPTDEDGEL